MIAVAECLRSRRLGDATRFHSEALLRRLVHNRGIGNTPEVPAAWAAGLEYLAARIEKPDLEAEQFARAQNVAEWQLVHCLDDLREGTRYRAYVGEWIRGEVIVPAETVAAEEILESPTSDEDDDDDAEEDQTWFPEWDEGGEEINLASPPPAIPAPQSPIDLKREAPFEGTPRRWKAPFLPYEWQLEAAAAWEANAGRGIVQVVTGAGKTALALYAYLRLLERVEQNGERIQLIVVVPRIELAKQWEREIRRLVTLQGLRLGRYHGGSHPEPERQDILIITQDSARSVLPSMWLDRPTLLVADECHRLGAPSASQMLNRDYTWTLGLSATPERTGDSAFETILLPRLGPVIFRYGYKEAVRDGIIAPFSVLRLKVAFTADETAKYKSYSDKITRLLSYLKTSYPELGRTPPGRFWQKIGDLRMKNSEDDAFETLTAVSNERRAIVHFASQKLDAVRNVATTVGAPRQVLCFHERIDAAQPLRKICLEEGRSVAVFHSQVPEPARSEALSRFRNGAAEWLIACRSLDEGLDIPAVDTILIVAGTKSPRQLIQRLGRALRRKPGKQAAIVILLEVEGVDDRFLDQEGVSELRDAAEEVKHIGLGDLAGVLRLAMPPETDRGSSRDELRPSEEQWSNRVRSFGRGLLKRLTGGAFTGTAGNKSYYSKDESPD
jgi:superfamily II DNA or RNA helicase